MARSSSFQALMKHMTDNGIRLAECTFILGEETAAAWSTLVNTGGQYALPELGASGGRIFGLPVLTSGSLPQTNSPQETFVVLVHSPSIAVADDGQTAINVTREAAVKMDDSPPDGATTLVSLFQANLVGFHAVRYVNWTMRRDKAVVVLRGINNLW
jgi:HK97 family phage major capsid protein